MKTQSFSTTPTIRELFTYGPDPKEETPVAMIILRGLPLPLRLDNCAGLNVRCCCWLLLRYNRGVRLSSEFRDGDRHLCQPLVHHTLGVATVRTLYNPHRTKNKTQEKQETNKTNGSSCGCGDVRYDASWLLLCVYEIPGGFYIPSATSIVDLVARKRWKSSWTCKNLSTTFLVRLNSRVGRSGI